MNLLITGCGGFIGSHLLERLLPDARQSIVGWDHDTTRIEHLLGQRESGVGQVFNIGNPANEITMIELADRMRRVFADVVGDAGYRDHPMEIVTGGDFYGPGYEDSDRRQPNIEKARRRLGWEPRIPLDTVLRQTVEFYVNKYGKSVVGTPVLATGA